MISKMSSIENKCFKLDHARSSIRMIQDHDFDINYKTRNRNRILKHDSDFELKNAPLFSVNKLFHRLWRTQILSFMPIKIYCDYTNKLTTCMFINKMSDHPLEV
jgi:hypothetical protein